MQHDVARTKQWQPNIRWNWHSPSSRELIWTSLATFRAHTDNWKQQLKTPRTLFGPQKNYFQIKWNSHQDHQRVPPQKHRHHRVPAPTRSPSTFMRERENLLSIHRSHRNEERKLDRKKAISTSDVWIIGREIATRCPNMRASPLLSPPPNIYKSIGRTWGKMLRQCRVVAEANCS